MPQALYGLSLVASKLVPPYGRLPNLLDAPPPQITSVSGAYAVCLYVVLMLLLEANTDPAKKSI